MPAPFTSGSSQSFNGNDANNLFQRGYAGLKLFQRVFLHAPHSGGPSRGSNEIGFKGTAQDGADRVIDRQQFIYSHAALVSGMIAKVAALRPSHAVRRLNPAHGREALGVIRRDLLLAVAGAKLSNKALG
jgi:hypothetical protein